MTDNLPWKTEGIGNLIGRNSNERDLDKKEIYNGDNHTFFFFHTFFLSLFLETSFFFLFPITCLNPYKSVNRYMKKVENTVWKHKVNSVL